jgi:hypothetical protein
MTNIITAKNGRRIRVTEVEATYKDTKENRDKNRVGKKYTKKQFRIMKGGALAGSEAGKVLDENPEQDWNKRYDPIFKQASDAVDKVADPILGVVGKIPVIGDALSTVMGFAKPLGLAINKGIIEAGYNPNRNAHYEVVQRTIPTQEDITRLQAKYGKTMKWREHMDELGEDVSVVGNKKGKGLKYTTYTKRILEKAKQNVGKGIDREDIIKQISTIIRTNRKGL